MQPVSNDAIAMTKVNKELVEKTSAVIKYQDGQAYVAGQAETTQVHKVNDVTEQTLKQGKAAELQSNLKNINIKMAYEDKSKRVDNEAVIQQITSATDPYEPGKVISMCDKSQKFHLTAMKATVAQNAAEKDGQDFQSRFEKPMYRTTKDIHYPVSSF